MRDVPTSTATPRHQRVAYLNGKRAVIATLLSLLIPLAVACGAGDDNEPAAVTRAAVTPPAPPTPLPTVTPVVGLKPAPPATPTMLATGTPEPAPTATGRAEPSPSVPGDEGTPLGVVPNSDIFVMQADGSAQRRLTSHPEGEGSPAWSPDGRSIAFTQWESNGVPSGVYVMDAAGTNVRQVADVEGGGPVWSPDGLQIAITSMHGYLGEYPQIYLVAVDGSGQQRLTSYENVPTPTLSMGNGSPAWSPDSRQIAFVSEQLDGPSLVHVIQTDGTQVRLLADIPGHKFGTVWSPNSEHIAFTNESSASGAFEVDIWVMRADGTDLRNLTASTAIESEPAWSPDGGQLAFVRQSDAGYQIIVITTDGAAERVLFDSPNYTFSPVWSPDGQRLAFVSGSPDENSEIWFIISDLFIVNADGSDLQQLTTTPESESGPVWSPDGTSIAYVVEFRDGVPEK